MAVDNTDLKSIFSMFTDELFTKVKDLQADTQMEDEHLATIVSEGVKSAMDSSVKALQVYKTNSLIDKQTLTEVQKALLVTADASVKNAQKISIEADKTRKDTQATKQNALLDKQALKVAADITFVGKQGTNMDKQVKQNCIIQAMDKAEGYNQGIGQAGLIPSQDMHTNFFIQNKALMLEGGVVFSATGKATLNGIVLGTYNVSPTASESTT